MSVLNQKTLQKNQFSQRFVDFALENSLLNRNERILIAYSGGLDSSVLLFVLNELKTEFGFELVAGYFNHDMRGNESIRESKFVLQTCKKYGILLESGTGNVKNYAQENKVSLQEAARKLRYDFFEKVADNFRIDRIATGHHFDDQAETVFMRFLQGARIKSLRGIPVRRNRFIRPLLWAKKKELHAYAKKNNIQYFSDSTNEKSDYFRNKVRLDILPFLRDSLPANIDLILVKYGSQFQQMHELIELLKVEYYNSVVLSEEKDKIVLDITSFRNYFFVLQQFVIQKCCSVLGILNESLIEKYAFKITGFVNEKGGKKSLTIDNALQVCRNNTSLILSSLYDGDFEIPVQYGRSHKLPWEGHVFHSGVVKLDSGRNEIASERSWKSEWHELVDKYKIKGHLRLRTWKPGDDFCPLGMKNKKKLSDFFIDLKVPLNLKNRYPLLVDKEKVVWVCGLRIDDRVKITSGTQEAVGLRYSAPRLM